MNKWLVLLFLLMFSSVASARDQYAAWMLYRMDVTTGQGDPFLFCTKGMPSPKVSCWKPCPKNRRCIIPTCLLRLPPIPPDPVSAGIFIGWCPRKSQMGAWDWTESVLPPEILPIPH
jgi:hypothetical protein